MILTMKKIWFVLLHESIIFFPLYKIKAANHLQYTHIQKPMSLLNLLYFQVTAKWDDPWVPPNPTPPTWMLTFNSNHNKHMPT